MPKSLLIQSGAVAHTHMDVGRIIDDIHLRDREHRQRTRRLRLTLVVMSLLVVLDTLLMVGQSVS